MGFQKAQREQIWVKTLLAGPSGSGKTYTALRLATGFAKACKSRIAYIDTENGRSKYYAKEFDYDIMILEAPYSSDKYIKAIDEAINAGYKVICIDSLSHEWLWCNETVNSMPGNNWANWGKVKTKYHNKFAEKIIQAPIHIFATGRGKDKWVTEEKNGKQSPKKVGEGIVQQDDTEYNYTLTFQLSQDTHVADCTKDNTHLFEGRYDVLTEKDGELLYKWANTGEAPAPISQDEDDELEEEIAKIDSLAKELIDDGVDRKEVAGVIKEICGTAKYSEIDDLSIAQEVTAALTELEEENNAE